MNHAPVAARDRTSNRGEEACFARPALRREDDPLCSLIFPAYNPGPDIERTWRQVTHFLRSRPESWEVLFVCDGCSDGTPERLAQWAKTGDARIRILQYAPNRGKGHAVRHGFGGGAWQMPDLYRRSISRTDLTTSCASPRSCKRVFDVAIASRTHPESQILLPTSLVGYVFRRQTQSAFYSWLVRLLLKIPFRDTQGRLERFER